VEGQAKALEAAYLRAGVSPSTVELVETHGTGTKVGDKVEIEALKKVFEPEFSNGHRCAIGSVKSMIGHTKAAAGAAGIIKTALSLHHKVLPPTLKVEKPDPNLDIDNSPFYLNTQTRPWFSNDSRPRRSGVSSFGFGGSNYHIVLEEYNRQKPEVAWDGSVQIVALSAPTASELSGNVNRFIDSLGDNPSASALASAAAETRRTFSHRDAYRLLWIPETSFPDGNWRTRLKREVETADNTAADKMVARSNLFISGPRQTGKIAFMFPGQGSQYLHMGRDLICTFPDAFKALQNADSYFGGPHRLVDYIYPAPHEKISGKKGPEYALAKTDVAQPAIGSLSLAMLNILERFDVQPDVTCGHSFGELTALLAAGWVDKDTFYELAVTRGRLMAAAGGGNGHRKGGMLAIRGPITEIEAVIRQENLDVVLANRNSPVQGVVSGSVAAIADADRTFHRQGFSTIELPVSAAFHSPLMGDAGKPFESALKRVSFTPSDVPVYSNNTAQPYPDQPDRIVKLLAGHLLNPVNFSEEIENLYESGVRIFVEVGPKSVLSGLTKTILKGKDAYAVAMDRSAGRDSGIADLARTLCFLSAAGHPVDLERWENKNPETRQALMNIPISGANYRKLSQPATQTSTLSDKRMVDSEPETTSPPDHVSTKSAADLPPLPGSNRIGHNDMTKKDTLAQGDPNLIRQALEAVQQGLESMQSLQQRTADAHQRFLETQQTASRTLQTMMESTQRLAHISMGQIPPALENIADLETGQDRQTAPSISPTVPVAPSSPEPQVSIDPPPVDTIPVPSTRSSANESGIETTQPDTNRPTATIDPQTLSQTLLAVVSELTGYPTEMINLEMDIEADLGIDSIKRVEILSSMEAKLPALPAVPPEIMGQMKSLQEILNVFSENGPATPDLESAPDHSDTDPSREQQPNPDLQETMLAVVSELTGYPTEMIDLDMEIEGDLGIDSIKRVEILSTLEEKMPSLPSVSPDMIGSLKTLGQIIAYLENGAEQASPSSAPRVDNVSESGTDTEKPDRIEVTQANIKTCRLQRKTIRLVEKPLGNIDRVALTAGRKCYITDDKTGLSQAIADELAGNGINTVLISADILKYKKNLPPAAGLIIVHGIDQSTSQENLMDAFRLTRNLGKDLLASAAEGRTVFASISRMDGAFGFYNRGLDFPLQGALAGLTKTADIEWDAVHCRAVDIAPAWRDHAAIAKAVVDELLNANPAGPVEVGLDENRRIELELVLNPIPDIPDRRVDLQKNDVVVVTGGGRGITAAAATALAAEVQPTLVLLGRSPAPTPEPDWLRPHTDEAAIKKAILENDFESDPPSPKQLNVAFHTYMANRDINATLEKIEAAGATAVYYSVDVRQNDCVNEALADVRKQFGPVRAVVHGAGVLHDHLIVDKEMKQFDAVFGTKVDGLHSLLAAVEPDHLKYLVIFSSVTARVGNRGQADYAMANETLNKMAHQVAGRQPATRVVSINWGPWDGGMVTPSLKREFESRQVGLIPVDPGVECLLDEMKLAEHRDIEVVIGSDFNALSVREQESNATDSIAARPVRGSGNGNGFTLTFKQQIELGRFPVLNSHVLDGKPVVPLALMTEWFGHGALHDNPDLHLHGLDNVRVLQGIKLENGQREVRLLSTKTRKNGATYEVDMELRDGYLSNTEVVHSRARALLVDAGVTAPDFTLPEKFGEQNYTGSISDVYTDILFHGDDLQGIRKISHLSEAGMVADISSAPAPTKWLQTPLRNKWIADPLVLDSAFQMAIIWCHEQRGMVSLPSYFAAYRQFRDKFPEDGVIAVLEVNDSGRHRMKANFAFLDADHQMVAKIEGYEAVMEPSLHRAFKP
jgi:acyl transferase domain-containing protein/NAD(P)-dependent dehydrogenase (short-subunit alcohol dehydrogenase family)